MEVPEEEKLVEVVFRQEFAPNSRGEMLMINEVVHGGVSRPLAKKAKWGTQKNEEKSVYKERVVQLRTLGVKTKFLIMAPNGINRNHMFQMSEGPLFYNQGQAGKLICFSLIFAYICTFGL